MCVLQTDHIIQFKRSKDFLDASKYIIDQTGRMHTVWFIFEIFISYSRERVGAPVAQWVRRWPTDLAPSGPSSPRSKRNLLNRKQGPLHTALHYPDMTAILLKRT